MKRQRGSMLLEMAILLPILLVLCCGTIEVCFALYLKFFVQYAAVSGAMYLSANNPPGQVKAYVNGLASGMGVPSQSLDVKFSHAPSDMSSCPQYAVAAPSWCVTVKDNVQLVIPFVNVNWLTLIAAAQSPGG